MPFCRRHFQSPLRSPPGGLRQERSAILVAVMPAIVAASCPVLSGCYGTGPDGDSSVRAKIIFQGDGKVETATFGAGCFWGVEAAFRNVAGVLDTAVGYAGGTTENPTYEQVCTGRTEHAEMVQVQFDPSRVSYQQLLDVYFTCHDPTQLNRQGPDVGSQYRSVIFCHDDAQRHAAEAKKEQLAASGQYAKPIATEIAPAATFYRAEDYHQRYLEKRGMASCHLPQ